MGSGSNGLAVLLVLIIGLALILVYLWPTLRARDVRHPDLVGIAIVNLVLGWMLVPWVVALVWAYRGPSSATALKKCPDCAEDVKAEARKCKHCGCIFA
jgi:uncharacterized membrane protein